MGFPVDIYVEAYIIIKKELSGAEPYKGGSYAKERMADCVISVSDSDDVQFRLGC